MELIAKCTAAAIIACVSSLLIKKTNPELSFVLGIFIAASIMSASLTFLETAEELVNCARNMLGASSALLSPVLKCVGISFISKFGADFCRDASHSAAASALELAGCGCAAAVAMPLVISMMKMIGTMI